MFVSVQLAVRLRDHVALLAKDFLRRHPSPFLGRPHMGRKGKLKMESPALIFLSTSGHVSTISRTVL